MRPFSPSAAGSSDGIDSFAAPRPATVGLPALTADSTSALVPAAIRAVLEQGHRVDGQDPFQEVLNQQLCQFDPRRRVFAAEESSFNVAIAVARVVWHLGANSALSAIAFYEPRAQLFSDDGQILPGSNTGARLFGDDSGVDQVRGIVSRIRADASTRRAAAVVWRPDDAVRESRDIPCTLAIACHLRSGRLIATVSMRSNNALRLLPYNLFEFTMLAELIAAELDVELGPYWHSVSSLHVFEREREAALAISAPPTGLSGDVAMPAIPRGKGAIEEAAALVASEARMRATVVEKDWAGLNAAIRKAEDELSPYWLGLFCVLALFSATRAGASGHVDRDGLLAQMPAALRTPLLDVLG